MATALAAAYMNIPIAHTMGGEVSGTIDESIRHAVTKFAHVHFAASQDAGERIIRLGERPEDVHIVGCPRIDLVAEILEKDGSLPSRTDFFSEGVGDIFDLDKPFLLVSQHPVTTEYGAGKTQIAETLKAVTEIGLPAIVLWPNPDAGSEDIAAGIRRWREKGFAENMHFFIVTDRDLCQADAAHRVSRGKFFEWHQGRRLYRHSGREHRDPATAPVNRKQRPLRNSRGRIDP